jgi:hypothetical protein
MKQTNIQKSYCGIAVEPSLWDLEKRNIEPDTFVRFAKSICANAIRVGFFGHTGLAYYPSEIAPHALGLNGRDLFREFQESCKKHEIILVPYLNTHFDKAYFDKHPEAVSVLGGKKGFVEGTPLVKVCLNNPDYRKYTFSVAEEMVRKYDPDIVYIDSLKLEHLCTCDSCKGLFKEKSGFEIPEKENWGGREWDEYIKWYQQRYLELADMCARNLRAIKPSLELISNRESFYNQITSTPEFNEKLANGIFDGIHAEAALRASNQTYSHMTEQCYFGQAMKTNIWLWVEYVSSKWMYLPPSAHEMKLKIAKVLAGGGRPNIWSLTDMNDAPGNSTRDGIAQIYSAVQKYPEAFNGAERYADVAQLYSTTSAQYYVKGLEPFVWPYEPDENARHFQQEFQGLFRMSLFSRQLSTFILDGDLNYNELSKYKLLILPGAGIISPEHCEAIRKFVRAGGGLIATYESSLYDDKGRRLKNFMLADLFGVDFMADGKSVGSLEKKFHVGGYLKATENNPLWEKDALFPAAGRTLKVIPTSGKSAADFIYPGWYHLDYNSRESGIPSVICNEYGKGRVVYLPYEPGYAFSCGELPQMLDFFSGIIRWAKKGHSLIETNLPPTADIFVRKAEDESFVLHLINIPASDRAEISQTPLPIRDVKISLTLPAEVKKCKVLTGEKTMKWDFSRKILRIELKELKDYTVIKFS